MDARTLTNWNSTISSQKRVDAFQKVSLSSRNGFSKLWGKVLLKCD